MTLSHEILVAAVWVLGAIIVTVLGHGARRVLERRRVQPPVTGDPLAPVAPEWRPGGRILDDFVVERELGEGGMGIVYLVRSASSRHCFAVKRARPASEGERRDLLHELTTWINLPAHPHLTGCRFFTTVGAEIVIFAEYVDGGSLSEWIERRRLTSTQAILEVAMGMAWGLDAIHELGVVHQDVKPGNVLMTAAGVPKITDFGLARRRLGAAGSGAGATGTVGGTPAYCSPEHDGAGALRPQSDVWSWGLSVLEMFAGEATWHGLFAAEALEEFVSGERPPDRPVLPTDVADVLRRCFQAQPEQRWVRAGDAADALATIHQQRTGRASVLQRPPSVSRPSRRVAAAAPSPRRADARDWLAEAARLEGGALDAEEPADVEGSPRASAVVDIDRLTRALRTFDRLREQGRRDLDGPTMLLLLDKARAHVHGGDAPGAEAAYDRAIALGVEGGSAAVRVALARAYAGKATVAHGRGLLGPALEWYERAATLRREMLAGGWDDFVASDLAMTYINQAVAVRSGGDGRRAVALLERAIALYLDPAAKQTPELLDDLANALASKAVVLSDLGELDVAFPLLDQAIDIYRDLVRRGRKDMALHLARAQENKAIALASAGDLVAAVHLHREVIACREGFDGAHLPEARRDLALTHLNTADALERMGDDPRALAAYAKAVALLESAVGTDGLIGLRGELAWAKLRRAAVRARQGAEGSAKEDALRAMALLEAEARRTGRADLHEMLAWGRSQFR